MTITAAVVREQNVEFAVVLVKASVMQRPDSAKSQLASEFASRFPGRVMVLCAQDSRGKPTYYGRADIVRFLSNVFFEQLPWREYRMAA